MSMVTPLHRNQGARAASRRCETRCVRSVDRPALIHSTMSVGPAGTRCTVPLWMIDATRARPINYAARQLRGGKTAPSSRRAILIGVSSPKEATSPKGRGPPLAKIKSWRAFGDGALSNFQNPKVPPPPGWGAHLHAPATSPGFDTVRTKIGASARTRGGASRAISLQDIAADRAEKQEIARRRVPYVLCGSTPWGG